MAELDKDQILERLKTSRNAGAYKGMSYDEYHRWSIDVLYEVAAEILAKVVDHTDCDHPQINKATLRWNICPDCGQTFPTTTTEG